MKVITIGRSQDNDIVVNDEKVSRNHLQIVQDNDDNYSAVDLGSTNGTLVNGQCITDEVRLQANDVVKIGSTTLPWQSYFMAQQPPPAQPQLPIINPESKPKRTVWYIVAVATLLLLAGGGVLKVFSDKKQEKTEAESKAKAEETEKLQQETEQKETEAKKLQEEADKFFQKALISQSDEDKRLAEAKQKEANAAIKDAAIARAAQRKAENERDEAIKVKDGALKAKEKAEADKAEAEKKAKQVEVDANKKEKELRIERDAANEFAKQTLQNSFDENFPKLKTFIYPNKYYVETAKKMGYSIKKDEEAKEKIESEFKKADNAGKKKIVDAIKNVLSKKGTDEEAAAKMIEEKKTGVAKSVWPKDTTETK
jgi:flagellar basal body-associated protein FliL